MRRNNSESFNYHGSGNPQGGPNPPQGDSVLPCAGINSDSDDRPWSKAGSSTNYDYGSGGYVDSDDNSHYDSETNTFVRGDESKGYISKSMEIFDKKKNARIHSLVHSKWDAYHSPEVTKVKPNANVMHEPVRSEHKIHPKVWDKFIEHFNNNISPDTPLKYKPAKDTLEIEGKPLTGWAKFEEAGALLFLEKGKFKSLTNEHLSTFIDKKMDADAAKPVDWKKAAAEEMHRISRQ